MRLAELIGGGIVHLLGIVAIMLNYLVYYWGPVFYRAYHTNLDQKDGIEIDEDKYAEFVIGMLLYVGWLSLGLLTYNWFLFLPILLMLFIPKTKMSKEILRLVSFISAILTALAIINFSYGYKIKL